MERLYLLWLKITKDPMNARYMKSIGIGLLLLAVLAATIIWSVYGQPKGKSFKNSVSQGISNSTNGNSIEATSADRAPEGQSEAQQAKSEIDLQIATGDVQSLKKLLSELQKSTNRIADPATYLERLEIREKIAVRLDELVENSADQEFLVQQKMWWFIESATAAQRYKLDDSQKIKNVIPILKQAQKYETTLTKSTAAFAEIVVEIRTYLASPQGDVDKLANQWADRVRLIGADSMNEFGLAYRIYDFIGELWENRKYDVAFPMMFAFVDAFSGSSNDVISSRADFLRKLVEDRKQHFDKIKSREKK